VKGCEGYREGVWEGVRSWTFKKVKKMPSGYECRGGGGWPRGKVKGEGTCQRRGRISKTKKSNSQRELRNSDLAEKVSKQTAKKRRSQGEKEIKNEEIV